MIDKLSDTWREIRAYAEKQIEDRRDRLEQGRDNVDVLRGEIKAWREVLVMGEPQKPAPKITTKPDY